MDHEKNRKRIVRIAKGLRKRMSLPEVLLWQKIKPSVNGLFDIRRQHPILDNFVLDFFHPDLQLAIEINGKFVHEGREEQDAVRQAKIEATGIAFVRIPASWVLRDPEAVASLIISLCARELEIDDLDESLL